MKLFWKIFLSVVTAMTVIFCISGHVLIYSFFESLLNSEIDMGKKSNLSFLLSLEPAIVADSLGMNISDEEISEAAKAVRALEISNLKQNRIYNENFQQIFVSNDRKFEIDKKLLQAVKKDSSGYEIKKNGKHYFLYVVSSIELQKKQIYLESVNDVTEVFEQKEQQYQIYIKGILFLIFVSICLAAALSIWIVKPIQRLEMAAQEIGRGDFSKRMQVKSRDEIGNLAEAFNRMSAQIEKNVEELQEAAVRQEEFTGSFAHELKTPLTSIIGYSDMLRSRRLDEETRMIYANYIYQQGKRLETLSKKMLELIVLEKNSLIKREINLKDLFEEIQGELEPVLKKQRIAFSLEMKDAWIHGDPDLLKTVFLNMIDNGMKAIGDGGTIQIRTEYIHNQVVVEIIDDGKGIPQKEIHKVTDSFYMVDKSRKYESGSVGLGLSICKRVLEYHQAELCIESEEGKGTTMRIRFEGEV